MSNEEICVRGCGIVTISSTHYGGSDDSGTIVRDALVAGGHKIVHQRWILDDLSNIRYLFREWVDDPRVDVVVAIGGTGLDSTDVTPEALRPLVTKAIPGFGEMLRRLMFEQMGIIALETRAQAALCYSTLVYLVPGLPEAVSIAAHQLIVPQLNANTS